MPSNNNGGGCNSRPTVGDAPPLTIHMNMMSLSWSSLSSQSLRRIQSLPTLVPSLPLLYSTSSDSSSSSSSTNGGAIRRSTSLINLIEEALAVLGDGFEEDFGEGDAGDDDDEHRASLVARVRARRNATNGRRGNNSAGGPNSSSQ
jgi:hypothetical protein